MPRRHYGPLFRLCGTALLWLALLPVTAPFSTLDLADFVRGAPADTGVTQAKTGADKLSSAPGLVVHLELSRTWSVRHASAAARPDHWREPVVVPLRL